MNDVRLDKFPPRGARIWQGVCPLNSPVIPDFFFALPPPFCCSLLHVPQRSQVKGWNQKGALRLDIVPELNIDLPPQTILDVELVEETTVRYFTLKIPEWLGIDMRT